MSALSRPRYAIPDDIRDALDQRGLMDAYHARPDFQQNDYVGWITRAVREDTREKRLGQMLTELEAGDAYMGMPYAAKRP